ncbi:MAG: helix-turn-helix domain-containing protein [Bacteroidota bacterium]
MLNRIENSQSFGSSSTYSRLLRFLVDCTKAGDIPKEQTIAQHLFGNNAAGSDTSKIRVYIYHLRKKLGLYLEQEGKEEAYQLLIPKGSYKVTFQEASLAAAQATPKLKLAKFLPYILGVLICSLLANAIFLFRSNSSDQKAFMQSSFWKEFFEEDRPVQVILGDLFIFSEKDSLTGEERNLRVSDINTPTQFDEYRNLAENTNRTLSEMTYTHLSKGSAEWIFQLTKILHPEKEFNIRPYSRIEAKDLHDYNIIFVGMQKTAGIFNSYFDKSQFGYDIAKTTQYTIKKEGKLVRYEPSGDPNGTHKDYGLIAKYPGPNNNTIFLFADLWDSATSVSLSSLTTISKMKEVEAYMSAQLGYVPKYFEILLEVNGVDRVGFEAEILHLYELD